MIFKDRLADSDPIDLAILAQHFFLAALGVPFICLFISAYPDI